MKKILALVVALAIPVLVRPSAVHSYITLTIDGVDYSFPEVDDEDWGQYVTDWAEAISDGIFQKTGGTFPLSAEAFFGSTFSVRVAYLRDANALPTATTGFLRLGATSYIQWRDHANSSNLTLGLDVADNLVFRGYIVGLATSSLYASNTNYALRDSVAVSTALLQLVASNTNYALWLDVSLATETIGLTASNTNYVNTGSSSQTILGSLYVGGISSSTLVIASSATLKALSVGATNLYVLPGGGMGIGTVSPTSMLDVSGGSLTVRGSGSGISAEGNSNFMGSLAFRTTYYFVAGSQFITGHASNTVVVSTSPMNGCPRFDHNTDTPGLNSAWYKFIVPENYVQGSTWSIRYLASATTGYVNLSEVYTLSFATATTNGLPINDSGTTTLAFGFGKTMEINGANSALGGQRENKTVFYVPGLSGVMGGGNKTLWVRVTRNGDMALDTSNTQSYLTGFIMTAVYQQ